MGRNKKLVHAWVHPARAQELEELARHPSFGTKSAAVDEAIKRLYEKKTSEGRWNILQIEPDPSWKKGS